MFRVLFIEPTYKCNLSCDYCYVGQQKMFAENVNINHIKDLITFMINTDLFDKKNPTVMFAGGEPMLYYNMLIELIDFIHEVAPFLNVAITTNGEFLTPERTIELANKKVMVNCSLDGIKEVQDTHRKKPNKEGSFDYVFDNIQYCIQNNPLAYCQSTFTPQTINHLFSTYSLMKILKPNKWIFELDITNVTWERWALLIAQKQFHKVTKDYIQNRPFPIIQIDELLTFIESANLSRGNILTLKPNGKVIVGRAYAANSNESIDEIYKIGNITSDKVDDFYPIIMNILDTLGESGFRPIGRNTSFCDNCPIKGMCFTESENDNLQRLISFQQEANCLSRFFISEVLQNEQTT